jgi:hypothetical protein
MKRFPLRTLAILSCASIANAAEVNFSQSARRVDCYEFVEVALGGRTTSGLRWKEPMIVSNDDFQYRLEPWPAACPLDIANPGYDIAPVLCLAQPGERNVVYLRQGGTATVELPAGDFRVRRFNQRTAQFSRLRDAKCGAPWTSPLMPDTEPWALVLERN